MGVELHGTQLHEHGVLEKIVVARDLGMMLLEGQGHVFRNGEALKQGARLEKHPHVAHEPLALAPGRLWMFWPRTCTVPGVGSSTPMRMFNSVLFPQPDPPRTVKTSPAKTSRLTPLSTLAPFGNALTKFRTTSSGLAAGVGAGSGGVMSGMSSNQLSGWRT